MLKIPLFLCTKFQQETEISKVCAELSYIFPDTMLFFTLLYLDYFVIQTTSVISGFDFLISNNLKDQKFGIKMEDRRRIKIQLYS